MASNASLAPSGTSALSPPLSDVQLNLIDAKLWLRDAENYIATLNPADFTKDLGDSDEIITKLQFHRDQCSLIVRKLFQHRNLIDVSSTWTSLGTTIKTLTTYTLARLRRKVPDIVHSVTTVSPSTEKTQVSSIAETSTQVKPSAPSIIDSAAEPAKLIDFDLSKDIVPCTETEICRSPLRVIDESDDTFIARDADTPTIINNIAREAVFLTTCDNSLTLSTPLNTDLDLDLELDSVPESAKALTSSVCSDADTCKVYSYLLYFEGTPFIKLSLFIEEPTLDTRLPVSSLLHLVPTITKWHLMNLQPSDSYSDCAVIIKHLHLYHLSTLGPSKFKHSFEVTSLSLPGEVCTVLFHLSTSWNLLTINSQLLISAVDSVQLYILYYFIILGKFSGVLHTLSVYVLYKHNTHLILDSDHVPMIELKPFDCGQLCMSSEILMPHSFTHVSVSFDLGPTIDYVPFLGRSYPPCSERKPPDKGFSVVSCA